jgi:hypothetical protein
MFAHRSDMQVFGTQPPPPSFALQLPILNSPFLGQLDFDVLLAPHSANSSSSCWQCRNHRLKKFSTPSPSTLPTHSRSPHLRQVDHAATNISTFQGKLHPSNNFHKELPETSSRTPQTASALLTLPAKTSRKREKQCARLPPWTHTTFSQIQDTHTTLLHFLRQLDRVAQTPVLRSLFIWQVVVKKEKRKMKTKLNRQPRRLLVSAISACMHIPACMYSHGSLSIWHGHFPCQLDLQTLSLIFIIYNF